MTFAPLDARSRIGYNEAVSQEGTKADFMRSLNTYPNLTAPALSASPFLDCDCRGRCFVP